MDATPHERVGEVEEALERDDPIELTDLVLEVALDHPDREFAETCCVALARHRSAHVRGSAVLGFGHIARRFGRLDGRRVKRLVDVALHDNSDHVREQARSAVEDLATFLSWDFDVPERGDP